MSSSRAVTSFKVQELKVVPEEIKFILNSLVLSKKCSHRVGAWYDILIKIQDKQVVKIFKTVTLKTITKQYGYYYLWFEPSASKGIVLIYRRKRNKKYVPAAGYHIGAIRYRS